MRVKKPRKYLRFFEGDAGVDEAGKGPLAGPVFAAAVILPPGFRCPGLNDSKQVDRAKREEMARLIKAKCIYAISFAEVEEIDRLNIHWATMAAMARAVHALSQQPRKAWIDGNCLPRDPLPCEAEAVIDGDAKIACIAAASILAKTARDQFMTELGASYPQYGFGKHFGYSTPEHKRALAEFGPSEVHRRTFWPWKQAQQLCLTLDE